MKLARLLPLLLGLAAGIAAGLFYAWSINPVEYVDAAPASLKQSFKEDYLALIAAAYDFSSDLDRARARLDTLHLEDPASDLSRLAQSRLAAGRPQAEVLALAQLAAVLGDRPAPVTSPPAGDASLTPSTPTASPTASPTVTRTATLPPTATPGAPFTLSDQEEICDPDLETPQLQIVVLDASGDGVPGVELLVIWDAGQDRFYTGLKPELGPGYADFTMQPGVTYALQLEGGRSPVSGLSAPECIDAGSVAYPGSWLLTFEQPILP